MNGYEPPNGPLDAIGYPSRILRTPTSRDRRGIFSAAVETSELQWILVKTSLQFTLFKRWMLLYTRTHKWLTYFKPEKESSYIVGEIQFKQSLRNFN